MKALSVLAVFLMTGCASYQTLEELEDEAMKTGNWAAVEKRERVIARREARTGLKCAAGYVGYCESYGTDNRCACLPNDTMRDMLAGWPY